ncbi:TonB-dependent receptor [Glaciecola sp. XM2]|jgi:outer membrane receptor protein involved in Fe transport|uniref:TonB-dependent receptor plug domain-containing protein n=1 Tax=Glaciecola sp. XM2 TaxID=1914931 RepID=UPI001BDDE3D8|nr:TonB-dependent receptor [Glaciecola sp. XM2]MBT1449435.1 TonB-dependent receptor [Glaciecola sp. XM2]
MKFTAKKTAIAAVVAANMFALPNIALAQQDDANEAEAKDVELILVTGSFVRRSENFESPSPLAVVDSVSIDAIGAKNIADITQTLTINTGAENNPDAFTQNATAGTSNINLRGLGVASTLVLLNSRRQVVNAQQTNEGLNFVDTSSLVPMIAIDRVEIIKDGASALYGSDAVAGVVNFITKRNYDGVKITADYQDGAHGDNSEYILQGLWGASSDRGNVMAAISYTDRSPLFLSDRRLSRPQDDSSNLGNPGSYFGVPGIPAGVPVIDPTGCAEFGGNANIAATVPYPGFGSLDLGTCQFDFGPGYSYVPEESRINAYVKSNYELTDTITWVTEFGLARNRAERGGAPSFPNLRGPIVPATHPDNPFGTAVQFLGRAEGNGFEADPANTESETFRFNTALTGEMDNGFWEISYTNAKNEFLFRVEDVLNTEFNLALSGFGGANCDPSSPAAVAGQGPCEYFNPFATSFTTSPNSQYVIDSFSADQVIDSEAKLQVLEGFASFDVFEMDGGFAGLAVGLQYREEELSQDYDQLSNQDSFSFVIGNPDFSDSLDVWAAFAEMALPVNDQLDIQLALRYENYGGSIGDTVDPKLAFNYRFTDDFSLRGSISTSFRAPSIFMRNGGATSLQQLTDPVVGGNAFAAVRTAGNTELTPEESTAYNFGFSFEPIDDLSVEIDYWNFEFEDLIIQESAQALLNSNPTDTSRIVRAGDPLTGPVLQVNNTYVNASSLETNGLDIVSSYKIETEVGTFTPNLSATYILAYDLNDPQAGQIDGAGRRNFTNIGVSSPELRANLGLTWTNDIYSANLFARYVSSYDDDQNCSDGTIRTGSCGNLGLKEIDSHVTYDAQFNVDLGALLNTETNYLLTVGGINLTDENPPQVFTNSGFDSKVHDPRGRQLYVRLAVEF